MKLKKIFAVICLLAMLVVNLCSFPLPASAASDAVTFEDNFNNGFSGGSASGDTTEGAWVVEYRFKNSSGVSCAKDSLAPSFANGVMKFDSTSTTTDGIRLNWQKLEGFGAFDANKTYTLTFDAKITDLGDDVAHKDSPNWNRELYFALAGYYNQVEFRSLLGTDNKGFGIRAGENEEVDGWNNTAYVKDETYNITVVWQPSQKKVTSTVAKGGNTIATGARTHNDYAVINEYTQAFNWRCEDGAMEIDNITFTDGTATYSENFDNANNSVSESLNAGNSSSAPVSGIWSAETVQREGTLPEASNGKLVFNTKDSLKFDWTKVPNVGEFSTANKYTFEFDTKITDKGNGNEWGGYHYTRALYVGFGGWFTLLNLPNKDGKAEIQGGDVKAFDDSVFLNKDLHVTITWLAQTISTQVTDSTGTVILSGSRSSDNFVKMNAWEITTGITDSPMKYLVLRCEDGAIEVDNFKFKAEVEENALPLAIPSGKQAIYECDINYQSGTNVTLYLGGAKLVSLSGSAFQVGGKKINGSYGTGVYKIKAHINPAQEMVTVEVVKPDGGIVRRGSFQMLGASTISVDSNVENVVSNVKLNYESVTVNNYTLKGQEPSYSGVAANIYNVVTSFNKDAATTRNFAWTAKATFIGGADMAVKYRVKGTDAWTEVKAEKISERVLISDENYYDCDVSGLAANTEYEYKIGKSGSTNDSTDWSKIYTFKTAAVDVSEFSFIAIGDTQPITWGGDNTDNKGAKYALAAYEQAFKEIEDPAFIMHTGDVVEQGNNKAMWNWFFKSLNDYGTEFPLFATMGNHDSWITDAPSDKDTFFFGYHFNHPDSNISEMLDQTDIANITDARLKYIASVADETIYSYNYGDVHFISLNSGAFAHSQDKHMVEAQREWLEADLEANKDAKWIIIFQHQPVYHRQGGDQDRDMLNDIIEGYGVDLVIQGHSHLVTRSYPMINGGEIATKKLTDLIPKGTGTIYTTIGSTALNHDGLGDAENVEEMFSISIPQLTQPAYTTVSIDGDSIIVTTKQLNGLILDQFTIKDENATDDDNGGANNGGANNDGENNNDSENEENNTNNEGETNNTTPSETTPNTNNGGEEKKGCKSSITASAAIAITVMGLGVTILKKKES